LQRGISQFGENTSKVIIAKSLAGFLNADGGSLIIGVKEVKDTDDILMVGIDSELHKLKDKTLDGYRRMILDYIIKKYLPSFIFNRINDYIRISFQFIDGVNICLLTVLKSDKRVFLKLNGEDVFMVRIDASSRQIMGNDLVEYCLNRF
jgi:predicted HTH transcriptional regulator